MSEMNAKILLLQKISGKKLSPEALMYGASMAMKMDPDKLSIMLEESDETRKEELRKEIEKALKIIEESKLDLELIRLASPIVLQNLQIKTNDEFMKKVSEAADFDEIISAIIAHLPEDYKENFHKGKTLDEVLGYYGKALEAETDDSSSEGFSLEEVMEDLLECLSGRLNLVDPESITEAFDAEAIQSGLLDVLLAFEEDISTNREEFIKNLANLLLEKIGEKDLSIFFSLYRAALDEEVEEDEAEEDYDCYEAEDLTDDEGIHEEREHGNHKKTEDGRKNWETEIERLMELYEEYPFEGKQLEMVRQRVRNIVNRLIGTEREKQLEDMFFRLKQIRGLKELLKAHVQFSKNTENNALLASYKKAGHAVMRNIWKCLVSYKDIDDLKDGKLISLSRKYDRVYEKLINTVIGQDYAVNEFVQACFDAELYKIDANRPQAVFLFAGPPGVGKTYLAKNVAQLLERPFERFDMGSYAIEKSDLALLGVEPGFRNAVEGTLVGFVEDHPDAVILFDEIEKAHPDVTRLFLSVLDGAKLENKLLTSNTDFSNCILIFTTNAGKSIYEDRSKNLSATPTDVILKEMQKEKSTENGAPKFPPELCSRFASNHIVMFNHIGITDMVKLVDMKMDETCREIAENLKVDVSYDDRLPLLLLMHYGNIDVRVVTGKAQQFIRNEIYELARQMVRVDREICIKSIHLSLDDLRISPKAKKFFELPEERKIGIICGNESKKKFEKIENIQITFLDSVEKLMENDLRDYTAILVDPYFEMQPVDDRILGLDDYDSVGLKIIKELLQHKSSVPVYLLEDVKKVSHVDQNTFYMRGVKDTVNISKGSVQERLAELMRKHSLQDKCDKMLNRRKIFDFESLQEAPDENGRVVIRFYDIVVKDAVKTEDEDLLISVDERPDVRFADVIGAQNAKAELGDFVKYLENPKKYMKNALAVPKGILLYGPPGTGKTMLAKAMAGETDATFISISAAELRMGGGEYNVKRLFETARRYAPAIVFVDEVDAIAKKRTGGIFTSSAEEALLNMFLTQMDGFEQHADAPVFVIAATNFGVEVSDNPYEAGLDPAFMRRFGNKILIDLPNKDERKELLCRKLQGKKALENNVTDSGICSLAERTQGQSLAELQNILEFAFRNAARKGELLNDEILDDAMETYFYGEERKHNEEQLYRTAIHEASHAYIYFMSGKKPAYLTVISRGNFGGYMQHENSEDSGTVSKKEFLDRIRTSLAGRIGEQVVFGDDAALNTGASSDLRNASGIALSMLVNYGMQEGQLFTMSFENLLKSNMLPYYVEKAERILQEQEQECRGQIIAGKDKIIALAKTLVERGHLNQEEIAALLTDN